MKVTINGFIHYKTPEYIGEAEYSFSTLNYEDQEFAQYARGRVLVMPHDIEVDVPDSFDPTHRLIAALEKEKANVRREFNARIAQLNEQIGKLQALTFDEVKA